MVDTRVLWESGKAAEVICLTTTRCHTVMMRTKILVTGDMKSIYSGLHPGRIAWM